MFYFICLVELRCDAVILDNIDNSTVDTYWLIAIVSPTSKQ